jgi:hypothetical protein
MAFGLGVGPVHAEARADLFSQANASRMHGLIQL